MDPISILVVDDDPDLRETICQLLLDEGYQVTGARNGLEALARLGGTPRPAVVLLDLMMPEMSGWEVRQHMLADAGLASIPVVVMTASQNPGGELAPAELLKKPLDLDQLLDAVRRHSGTN